MFHDVHEKTDQHLRTKRVPGATFDEVTYADDTICISTCTKAMNAFIAAIEEEGLKNGLKLNKNKCELLATHKNANIHFQNGERIRKQEKAQYLGCELGIRASSTAELNKRFANTMITMKKLDIFWRHSNCDIATKIHVAEAVLRAKLLYGLESTQLNPAVTRRLETFQLKVLRKILRLDTTYVNRENTHNLVFQKANEELQKEKPTKKVTPFIEAYKKAEKEKSTKNHQEERKRNTQNLL